MDKKIGNLSALLLILLFTATTVDASLSLVVKDMHGQSRKKIALGIPFSVEVQVTDGPNEEPELGLPQEIKVIDRSVSSSYRSLNGKTSGSRTYTYHARIDQEGTFIVGPARMRSDNRMQSNTVTLEVQQTIEEAPLKRPFFVETSVKPEKIYVGQEATFFIRFYYATDNLSLERLEDPSFNDCYATKMKGPVTGVATRDGVDYKYMEWQSTICPKKVGPLVIPALAANVAVNAHSRRSAQDMFSLMDMMFGSGRVERHYSNALSVDILPLPKHSGPVHGVGTFTSYTAKVNLKEASVGEGVVYTLELVGTGNTQAMVHPILDIPEQIKYYDSHAKEKLLSDLIKKKDFEYILQALEPGTYTIPAQKYTFFDPQTKRYKTLSSAPVTITITGQAQQVEQKQDEETIDDVLEDDTAEESLAPIYKASWRAGMPRRYIPWMWYMVLLVVIASGALLRIIHYYYVRYRMQHQRYYQAKHAFSDAKKALYTVILNQDTRKLYGIFKKLFAHKLSVSESVISQDYIHTVLAKAGMDSDELQQWDTFFDTVTQVHFGLIDVPYATIKKQSEMWLNRLEKVLS